MDRHSHRILSRHFAHVKYKLLSFASHFEIAKHGDMKGYGREALTEEFLKSHLSDQIDFLTGEIVDTEDIKSGQIDIILQSKKSPKIPLWGNIHLSYADSVIAAIEVKSNLTTQHLNISLDASKKVKALNRDVMLNLTPLQKPLNKIPYIIFAFTGLMETSILKTINNYASKNKIPVEDFAPDMIIVLDKDYYMCKNNGWQFPITPGGYYVTWTGVADENLVGLYNYLTNVIVSYNSEERIVDIPRYFEKSVGK